MTYRARKAKIGWSWLVLAALPALAAELAAQELVYRRRPIDRQPVSRPARGELPSVLRVTVPDGPIEEAPSFGPGSHLARAARRAASWTARQLLDREGRHEAYQVGFYDGLQSALRGSNLGEWDYNDGLENGRRSQEAHHEGSSIGYDNAREAADREAFDKVSEQFHDLSHEPQPWPHTTAPALAVPLPEARPPDVEELFGEYPLYDFLHVSSGEHLPDPRRLARCRSYSDFYNALWADPGRAFNYWGSATPLEERTVDQRSDYFREMFLYYYRRELARIYYQVVDRAYTRGFTNGWDYGAFITCERAYRRGYCQGWNETLRESAEIAFRRGFEETYAERYGEYFHDWSTSPKPEIGSIIVGDGNDDGVLEPGEALAVEYELINYGGAPGYFTARLDGDSLTQGVSAPVNLPRRAVVRSVEPLVAEIDPAVRPRSMIGLGFAVAGLDRQLSLKVSYPLELDKPVRFGAHDAVAGRAEIGAVVRNTSRRPVPGEIELRGDGTPPEGITRSFAEIGAGEYRRIRFELAELDPLDLLGGAVQVELVARSGAKVHDRHRQRLPELAVDLGNRELLRFMQHLARGAEAPPDQVRRAQELMLRRLEIDWRAVVARSGNDYKKDVKNGSRITALGDLVATYQADRIALVHREVFTALAPRIEALAKSMPGAHPFLRRWMKKLARKLAA